MLHHSPLRRKTSYLRRAGPSVVVLWAALLASPKAEARCGELGGIEVFLVASTSAGTALLGGLITPGVIALNNETRDYPYGRNAALSLGAGLLVSGLYTIVDLSTDCGIASGLEGGALVVVPAVSLSISVLTAALLWLYADELEEPPVQLGFIPHEGGGSALVGFRF